jgi:hypothetical protein
MSDEKVEEKPPEVALLPREVADQFVMAAQRFAPPLEVIRLFRTAEAYYPEQAAAYAMLLAFGVAIEAASGAIAAIHGMAPPGAPSKVAHLPPVAVEVLRSLGVIPPEREKAGPVETREEMVQRMRKAGLVLV